MRKRRRLAKQPHRRTVLLLPLHDPLRVAEDAAVRETLRRYVAAVEANWIDTVMQRSQGVW